MPSSFDNERHDEKYERKKKLKMAAARSHRVYISPNGEILFILICIMQLIFIGKLNWSSNGLTERIMRAFLNFNMFL